MSPTILLAVAVATTANATTLTNESDLPVVVEIQVYEGHTFKDLAPGQSYMFDDLPGSDEGAYWAVWVDGAVIANGRFAVDLPSEEETGPTAEPVATVAPSSVEAPVASWAPVFRRFGGWMAV